MEFNTNTAQSLLFHSFPNPSLEMTPLSHLLLRLRRAATWTALMTAAVVLASFSPEVAFVWALSHPAARCEGEGDRLWVPLDGREGACLPSRAVNRSTADVFVPPVFAALVVGASACFVKAVAWGRAHTQNQMP
ncbi:hypothetical protein LUZ63_012787 [Rhynchospora breviuscula]|uniref:Uncharacterized protein n=1 Tax=Rhynchospora breviuscula TaxID=2022672 RepID=A0A9Q0HJL4_9POAL|nr:hypothetical protein LUZ63_012787 [Rhynchospora breviuscula]